VTVDMDSAIRGGVIAPPPGWGRITDHLLARLRARSIDDTLVHGGAVNGDPVTLVRRGRLLSRRYRAKVAKALRKMVDAARGRERNHFAAKIQLKEKEILENEPMILTLADELEQEEHVSPRGVILADRLVRDGDSPVYWPDPVNNPREQTVEWAVKHARAALHMG
jgi:hypothetical protein